MGVFQLTLNVTVPASTESPDTVTPFCADNNTPPQPSPKGREINNTNNIFFIIVLFMLRHAGATLAVARRVAVLPAFHRRLTTCGSENNDLRAPSLYALRISLYFFKKKVSQITTR
jgi:hypothetical protein